MLAPAKKRRKSSEGRPTSKSSRLQNLSNRFGIIKNIFKSTSTTTNRIQAAGSAMRVKKGKRKNREKHLKDNVIDYDD